MRTRIIDPVQRRNALLAISATFMAMAVAQRPALLLFFTSARITVNLAVSVVAAFFMALAIREFASLLLRGPGDPWYARRGAIAFLAISLSSLNAILTILARSGPMADQMGPVLLGPGMRFQLAAFEVLWLVLLEWVSYDNE